MWKGITLVYFYKSELHIIVIHKATEETPVSEVLEGHMFEIKKVGLISIFTFCKLYCFMSLDFRRTDIMNS